MYLPQYTERKGSKIPENRQMEHPDTLRNQQVMCSSHTTSSKKASKAGGLIVTSNYLATNRDRRRCDRKVTPFFCVRRLILQYWVR